MHGSANRSVVIVSGLLTLLLLCGATLALALHNGWLRTGAEAPVSDTLSAQSADPPLAGRGDRGERREHDDDDGPRERTVGRQRSERH